MLTSAFPQTDINNSSNLYLLRNPECCEIPSLHLSFDPSRAAEDTRLM